MRSLISAEKRHIVYFPGGNGSNHVQRLNTLTRECETIKLLTFAPRCLVARDGWLCCGSEHGEFVAIRLDDEGGNDNLDLSFDLDPETRLPLGLTSPGEDSIVTLLARARRSNKSLIAKNVKLAQERVNCITLWSPPTQLAPWDQAYTFPVAVLANNDRTVTLVNLDEAEDNERIEPLDVISYPDFVNRAIISPDGRLLISILDDPYLYVHERVGKSSEFASSTLGSHECCWKEKQRLLLKSQRKDDRSDSRGSFAACFSSSGAYLAVGTQHGTISIFDASLLTDVDADPLIATFTSSRPESGPGAIRDMAFCPGPFDILAWTEDRGHVGLADLRSNFVVRQIVDINADSDFEHINILDRNTVDPRLLDRRGDRRESNLASALGGSNLSDARRRAVERVESLNHPLTPNETMVLEAIQGNRRRRERANQRGGDESPASRQSQSRDTSSLGGFLRYSQNEGDSGRTRERSSSTSRAIGDLLGNYRDQRDRAHDRVRRTGQLIRDASDRPPPSQRPDQQWMERLGETVAAMRNQRERQDPSYLSVLEILQARERGGTTDAENDETSLLVPLVNQVVNRWEESAIRGTLAPDHGVFEVPPSPDNTAGLAWSEDGRTL